MSKIINHDRYRKELLSKCFDLFASKGYSSITMRQIADNLNVSTGTLYHYFSSKSAIFEQLVEEISHQDVLKAQVELEGAVTLQERIEALGEVLAKNEDYWIKLTYIWVDFYQHQNSTKTFKRTNDRYQQIAHDCLGLKNPALSSFVSLLFNGLIFQGLCGNKIISAPKQCALLGKILTAYFQQAT